MISLIYDGDIGPDPCDFTTIAVLQEYHSRGIIDLKAMMGVTPDPYLASTFALYNRLHGNSVPIGAYVEHERRSPLSAAVKRAYRDALTRFCHQDPNRTIFEKYGNGEITKAPDSVALYRQLLGEADDRSITIYAAGQLYNLDSLLLSPADEASHLTGAELVERKVDRFVFMGGWFPNSNASTWYGDTDGAEWNWWAFGSRGTTQRTLHTLIAMDADITLVGAEQGPRVLVGREIIRRLGRDHPTSEAFHLFRPLTSEPYDSGRNNLEKENPAFDEITAFHAVEDGVGTYFNRVEGRLRIDDCGANFWTPEPGRVSYLTVRDGAEESLRDIVTDRVTGRF